MIVLHTNQVSNYQTQNTSMKVELYVFHSKMFSLSKIHKFLRLHKYPMRTY